MNKFLFKSTDADLQKLYQLTVIIQKNVLYLTHQVDFIRKTILETKHDKDLQSTVDKYFDKSEYEEECITHPNDEKDID